MGKDNGSQTNSLGQYKYYTVTFFFFFSGQVTFTFTIEQNTVFTFTLLVLKGNNVKLSQGLTLIWVGFLGVRFEVGRGKITSV